MTQPQPAKSRRNRIAFPKTAPNGGRDLDLELHWRGRTFHSIGRPLWVLNGALAWVFNRPGRLDG
jgi:hypothetical protein